MMLALDKTCFLGFFFVVCAVGFQERDELGIDIGPDWYDIRERLLDSTRSTYCDL